MAELMGEMRRTHYCGTLRESNIGETVTVMGWVQRQRDLGSLIFIDLRDRTGVCQLAFDDETDREIFAKAFAARSEFVLSATGTVRERSSKNPKIPTGNIEVFVTELRVLSASETPPFEIVENSNVGEDLRLKYRYLDLRRPDLAKNIMFRHKVAKAVRDYFSDNGFLEIETPMLIRSTPEGARDYLVPSRIHQGSFYALPQSPQLYKQLLMVAGFDRYFQLARCFRDEDLRADRQPEFTQIDLEMSFVDVDDILSMVEGMMDKLFTELLGEKITLPIPRYTYKEVMERFGSDKPDMRYGLEIQDITEAVRGTEFVVFASAINGGGSVRAINAKGLAGKLTRKEIDKLTEYAKGCGAKGLAWLRSTEQGVTSSFAKFLTDAENEAVVKAMNVECGDVLLIMADTDTSKVLSVLGMVRVECANRAGIEKKGYCPLWVTEFPFFEFDKELGDFVAMHHPFTAPLDECLPYLETDKANVRAKAYDLVLNGVELASGSIRITEPTLQKTIFRLLGISDEQAQQKFGFLTDAFRFGPPPHGGMALGLDRLVMQLLGCDSLRDVVAFPKVQNASELMTACPSDVPEALLDDLGIKIVKN